MACCYACKKEISYFALFRGYFGHFKRNLIRKNLPVFDCPHCGETCQEYAWSYYGFILVFIAIIIGIAQVHRMNPAANTEWRFPLSFLVFYIAGNYLWWKWIAKLKEPYLFWGN